MRFKNRYLLFELVWKDGKFDDSISEAFAAGSCMLGAATLWDAMMFDEQQPALRN